jgi:predicted DCC family thiol-disulfide oxidoreductase YuxK
VDGALLFIVIMLAVIFVVDAANRWWRENKWRWRRDDDDRPRRK